MEHIKGPWKLAAHIFVDDANLKTVCVPNGSSPEEREARARLIAAAPELLEALKNARIVLGEAGSDEHVKQLTDTELGRLWIAVTKEADAAIAKAEGK